MSRGSRKFLYAHHVAKRLGRSVRTIRYWAKTGKLKAHKDGPKIWIFDFVYIESLAESGVRNAG